MQDRNSEEYFAHSRNDAGQRHLLVDHLTSVANLAQEFAAPFGGGDLAYYAGLWHDLGKFNPAFKDYLRRCEADPRAKGTGPEHSGTGTIWAYNRLGEIALLDLGHHGGLAAQPDFRRYLAQKAYDPTVANALRVAAQAGVNLIPSPRPEMPSYYVQDNLAKELFLRVLFSALVDADYLDTESHFNPERSRARGADTIISQLWDRLEQHYRQFSNATGPVNDVRREVYQACLAAAEQPPGLFHLTVPTGGGKTLAGMAFALRHAMKYNQRRIIVAVPFISITQQTAQSYREAFQDTDPDHPIVLEHHSGTAPNLSAADDDFHSDAVWSRLAAENWDAPIVVTTTVQLFESLFANRPSATRKLHNLAKSVIILDEAQALPLHLLKPILSALRELCQHYGATVVLSTATQPAFQAIPEFADLHAREIVPDYPRHFAALCRVEYEWHTDTPLAWSEVAETMAEGKQALAIVNTKKDAMSLLDALETQGAKNLLHLSTYLCGAHRMSVIKQVKERLANKQPCLLVSTQVVEAGVDLDFPLVLRALGPLDSIIQAAGRCNREGKLAQGRVIIFRPEGGGLPTGTYRTATDITSTMLNGGPLDLHDPGISETYFWRLLSLFENDPTGQKIQEFRQAFNYPEVAGLFRMIDDATETAIITGYGSEEERAEVKRLIQQLQGGGNPRILMRKLQPYTVNLYQGQVASAPLAPIFAGVHQWLGEYHPLRGIGGVTTLDAERLVF